MKDLVIKGTFLKRELIILVVCFCFAVLLNIFSIIKYKTSWGELIGQLHIVIVVALFLYVIVFLVSWVVRGILKLVRK